MPMRRFLPSKTRVFIDYLVRNMENIR